MTAPAPLTKNAFIHECGYDHCKQVEEEIKEGVWLAAQWAEKVMLELDVNDEQSETVNRCCLIIKEAFGASRPIDRVSRGNDVKVCECGYELDEHIKYGLGCENYKEVKP